MGMILTNPFTEKLFYFDIPAGYMKGPWYMLMYYSALCHRAAALILIVIWRKKLGYQKVKSLLEILLISGAGVVIQLLYHPLLTTGFGMSLGILVLFITINNPHANIDTLTGLYNHLYLARKSNELISAGKSFHIITVYLYQLKHINKIAGVQGGNSILKLTARKLGEMCGKKAFRTTGKSFMILTGSLEEYEYYLTQLKRMFDGNSKLNVNNKIITMPVIISGIMNAQKLGDSGLILEYAEYLEALSAKNGLTEVIQDDYQTMNGFLYNKRAIFYESVVETFHKMNYHIVSEGVETQEEMEQISSWGVEMIQGYYFSKPLPEKELLELLKKQDNIER